MTKAAHFEAKKHAYRQTQDGIVISFVVHPNDVAAALATAPLGTRYMVAFAQIGDDEQPAEQKEERPKKPFHELSRAQQSGILRNDARFIAWLGVNNEEDAADYIRRRCRVDTCAKIDGNSFAEQRFDQILTDFRMATGQIAEQR